MNQDITFNDLGLNEKILNSIKKAGFVKPSPIQAQAIPIVLAGYDMVGQAHTGTGKTAAFSLPVLNNIDTKNGVELLVITPTRELATQVSDEIYKYGKDLGVKTVTIYGGSSYNRQIEQINKGASVVVATPGRMLDLLKKGVLKNFTPTTVVLDEADEMLDMGFLDDIQEIFKYLPKQRQTLLFSATMPEPIKKLANKILKEPQFVSITQGETTNKDIKQLYYVIDENERDVAILRLIEAENPEKAVVFCRTKSETDRLSTILMQNSLLAKPLHGDMAQREREQTIRAFKNGDIDILVATDVAARGIHVDGISHVFNYHIPFDAESYVHRIGRTGRAGSKGKAITLLTPLEFKELKRIKQKVKTDMELAFIPTKNDIKENKKKELVDDILNQHIFEDAVNILDMLKEEIDEEQILLKLISYALKDYSIKGPNYIGIPKEKLVAILERANKKTNDNKRGRRFSRRRGSSSNQNRRGRRR